MAEEFVYPFPTDDDLRFDKRVIPHRIRRNEVKREDFAGFIDGLEDLAELADESEVTFQATFANRA
ncbi:MAG: hypothetical protein ACON5B_15720 [Myxococcota bacterium]